MQLFHNFSDGFTLSKIEIWQSRLQEQKIISSWKRYTCSTRHNPS